MEAPCPYRPKGVLALGAHPPAPLRQGPLGVLSRWIEATKKETRYDFEQKTLRALYQTNVRRAIARIPMGPDTWHFGACCKKSNRSAAPCRYTPANWITHVPTP